MADKAKGEKEGKREYPHLVRARAKAKELGRLGGRPKGSLDPHTIAAIQTREAFVAAGLKMSGKLLNDLDRNSSEGDTKAATAILDRVGIAPVQRVQVEGNVKFTLLEIAGVVPPMIDGNPNTRILEAAPDTAPVDAAPTMAASDE